MLVQRLRIELRISVVMRLTCSRAPCFAQNSKWCDGSVLCVLRWGLMRSSSTFSNNLDRQVSKLIGLYDDGCVLSFPGLGIMIIIDFFSSFELLFNDFRNLA